MVSRRTRVIRAVSLSLAGLLSVAMLTGSPARADELSDTQAALATSQAKLTSLQTSLTNANGDISAYTMKIAATDSSTADGQSAIEKFTTSLEAARAAKAVLESQITPLQTEISNLTIKVSALIAAINGANNCPADWGLTSSSFVDGLETGVFNFNSKIGAELAKDPRNIVISSSIQLSKDGSTWKTYREVPATTWVQYATLSGAKGSYYSRLVFMSDVYEMLRYSGSQVRVSTILDKQGCVTHNIISDVKPLTIASATFTKSSIDELYVAFPQAFPNYQVRDQAKAAVAAIATDFPAAAGTGSQYNFNKGGFSYFQLVTFPRSGACTGDFNYVTVNIGATCELGIYWLWNNTFKYIDSVSTVGGSSEAQKQQAAMLVQAKTLQVMVLKLLSNVEGVSGQIQSLNSKYSADWSKAGQSAVDQYMALYQSISESINQLSTTRQQLVTMFNSSYINGEIATLAKESDLNIAKALRGYDSLMSQVKASISQVQQYLSAPSAGAASELERSSGIKSQAQKDANVASSHLNEVSSFSGSVDYAKNYKAYQSKYLPVIQNAYTSANSMYSSIKNWIAAAQQNSANAQNSVDAQAWQNVVANFTAALTVYGSTIKVLNKALSIIKTVPTVQQGEAATELELAINWAANGERIAASVEQQLQQYPALLKAKGILANQSARDAESASMKSLAEKYLSEVSAISSRKENAEKRAAAGEADMDDWKSAAAYFVKAANFYTRTYKIYMQMLGMVQSGSGAVAEQSSTTTPVFIDLVGEEEGAAGSVTYKKDKQGRYLITVSSNQENTDFTIKAIKSKTKAIIFNASSDADGNIYIRTSRKLAGYVLQLVLDGEVLSKTSTLK